MTWTSRFSKDAAKQLRRLPRDRREQLGRAIEGMKQRPLRGDVRPVKSGRLAGALRRRQGSHRIIFSIGPARGLVEDRRHCLAGC